MVSNEPTARLPRGRRFGASLAILALGAALGVTSQHLASADISSGDRPVLVTMEPCRLADTRPPSDQVGPRGTPLGAAETLTIDAQEAGTPCAGKIPAGAVALSLNVTALNATVLSFLTIWADGPLPLAASLNPAPGAPPVPNAVTVELSGSQTFNIYNDRGAVDVVVDVNGYYEHHDHDDRYPTDAEVVTIAQTEIAAAAQKQIQLPVAAARTNVNAGFTANFGRAGVLIPDDTANAQIYFSFVLPDDYTPDSTFYIDLLWMIDEASCDVRFQRSSSTIASPGEVSRSGDIDTTTFTMPSGGERVGNTQRVPWVPTGAGAKPGDAVHVGFYRSGGGADTCTDDLVIQGAIVSYE